jgi:PAS domain S-box-containing protein
MLIEAISARSESKRKDIPLDEKIFEEREQYRQLFENVPLGIASQEIVTDEKGKPIDYIFLKVNKAFENQTGLKSENIIDQRATTIVPDIKNTDPNLIALYGHVALSGESKSFDLFYAPFNRYYQITAYSPRKRFFVTLISDISERKKTEEALKRSEQLYRAIGESINFGVWVCEPDGRNIYTSESFLKLVGITQKECSDFGWGNVLHPDDAAKTIALWKECVKTGGNWNIEHRFKGVDGKWHPILARGIPIRDEQGNITAWAGINLDISEFKNTEQQLRESEMRFRTLADNISPLVWMADGQGSIFWYNKRWYEFTGTSWEQMQGWGWKSVHHPDHVEQVVEIWNKSLQTGAPWEDTFPLRNAHGEYRWFLSRAVPIRNDNGEIIRWFGTNTDITERLNTENSLVRRTEELASANKELESFSYSISHDLRTPLNAMKSFSTIIIEDFSEELKADVLEYLKRISISADKMSNLIDDMLSLSKISLQEINFEPMNLSSIAHSVIDELRLAEPMHNVEVKITDNLETHGDSRLLGIALSNLIGNAWKYSSKTSNAKIEFGKIVKYGHVIYFVRDNGAGFDMKFADKLFEPFKRLHTEREFPGTGIGLAIVKRVIEKHGGTIWAESEPGKGATFFFTLS